MSNPNDAKPQGQNPPSTPPKDAAARPRFGAFTVEACCERNRNPMFEPTGVILRGAWRRSELRGAENIDELGKFPDIPGLQITIDPVRKTAVVEDPLSHWSPQEMDALNQAASAIPGFARVKFKIEPSDVRDKMSDNDVKTWCYWVWRMVDAGDAKVVKGSLPSVADIEALPGKIRVGHQNQDGWQRFKGEPDPSLMQNPYAPVMQPANA